jgi:hypothetical protein
VVNERHAKIGTSPAGHASGIAREDAKPQSSNDQRIGAEDVPDRKDNQDNDQRFATLRLCVRPDDLW